VRWDLLIMRDEDDWSSSHTFKQMELGELMRSGFDVRLAIDDDPRNVEMYRKAGVHALYFHSGYYD
jgi:pyridoxine 5'-phosphate synthase PdxJ